MAIGTSNMVYVSNMADKGRIVLLTSVGKFVTSFGRRGEEPGEFWNPRGLAVDSSGILYVCGSNRVQLL